MGILDYITLLALFMLAMLAASCTKDIECDTEIIDVVERRISDTEIERTYVFETTCL
jgi:hypothetical protein